MNTLYTFQSGKERKVSGSHAAGAVVAHQYQGGKWTLGAVLPATDTDYTARGIRHGGYSISLGQTLCPCEV